MIHRISRLIELNTHKPALTVVIVRVCQSVHAGIAREVVVFIVESRCLDCNCTFGDSPLVGLSGTRRGRRSGSLSKGTGKDCQKGDSGEERFSRREHGVRREYSGCKVSEGEGSVCS